MTCPPPDPPRSPHPMGSGTRAGGATLGLLILVLGQASAIRAEEAPLPDAATICVSCRFEGEPLLEAYTDDDWSRLRSGRVLSSERPLTEKGPHRIEASTLIPDSSDRVWSVLTDFARWPEFMPNIRQTRVVHSSGRHLWVRQRFGVLFMDLEHTTIYELSPTQGRLSWTLDLDSEHDIALSHGRWQLLRLEGGRQTLVHYIADMDAGRPLPELIDTLLRRRSLQGMLRALRREVSERYASSDS